MATKRPTPDPAKFNEAVDAFRELVPMPFDQFEALTAAEQAWAFRVAHVTQASIVQDVFDALDSAILNGDTFDVFKKAVAPKLTQAWGAPNAPRVEVIFRTNTMRAYAEGRDAILESEPVKKSRPYLRIDGVGDNRQSEICESLDGTVRPADDPWWNTHRPPYHMGGCRTQLTPLTEEEAEAEPGFKRPPPETPIPSGFGERRPNLFDVDLDRFSEPLRNVLEKRIGKKDAA